jgi:hypothetical protein
MFTIGIFAVFYFNNFLNILLNGKDAIVISVFGVIAILGALEYYKIIELSYYSQKIFYSLYQYPGVFLIPVLLAIAAAYLAYQEIYKNFYLDKGLELNSQNRFITICLLTKITICFSDIKN